MELNRRQFVEGAGAAAAGVAAMGALAGVAVADEQEAMTADKLEGAKWSFEIAPDPIPEDQISKTVTHDIVVVGAGMAGVCTAVSAAEEGDRICLRVIDAGPGIPEQYRQSIFQPFFRVDKSRSREHGGVGLGLALVWEIAALHGGTAQVEESSENGTTMLIALPKRGINSGDGVAHPTVDKNLKGDI